MESYKKERDLYPKIFDYFNHYKVHAEEVPFEGRVIDLVFLASNGVISTVEAKLRDWRRALLQATINRLASDFSYVAVPSNHSSAIDLRLFAQRGVGLLIVDGRAIDEVRPRRPTFKDPELVWSLRVATKERS